LRHGEAETVEQIRQTQFIQRLVPLFVPGLQVRNKALETSSLVGKLEQYVKLLDVCFRSRVSVCPHVR
jgi:hypothetical protein